jgi:hypothetical protein
MGMRVLATDWSGGGVASISCAALVMLVHTYAAVNTCTLHSTSLPFLVPPASPQVAPVSHGLEPQRHLPGNSIKHRDRHQVSVAERPKLGAHVTRDVHNQRAQGTEQLAALGCMEVQLQTWNEPSNRGSRLCLAGPHWVTVICSSIL